VRVAPHLRAAAQPYPISARARAHAPSLKVWDRSRPCEDERRAGARARRRLTRAARPAAAHMRRHCAYLGAATRPRALGRSRLGSAFLASS